MNIIGDKNIIKDILSQGSEDTLGMYLKLLNFSMCDLAFIKRNLKDKDKEAVKIIDEMLESKKRYKRMAKEVWDEMNKELDEETCEEAYETSYEAYEVYLFHYFGGEEFVISFETEELAEEYINNHEKEFGVDIYSALYVKKRKHTK